MKHFYSLFLLLITSVAFAQLTPPSELQAYYSGVDFSETGNNLYNNLATEIIASHSTFLTYSDRHDYLYNADEDLSNTSNVILIYSGDSRNENEYLSGSNSYSPQTFNTEHVYPRSLLDNSNTEADLHLLRSCDISINSNRGNDPFTAGSGTYGSTGSAWYPGDDWRGDVARIIMYVNLRYNEPFTDVGNLNLFLEWNAIDPVSPFEDQRNEVISGVQGVRNPFIDNPYIATVIWGGTPAENRWSTLSTDDFSKLELKIYPNPVKNNIVYFSIKSDLDIIIYNVLGKEVITETVSINKNYINIENLKKGIYIVKLISEHGQVTKKLIKQ
ncbi:endonuclease [Sabulilitoribacter multivorans]|uniref:Endonuclease n=1 Tax=Flaviramulus multivorans TaxID=1304750 RepID=A0ABS9IL90_9FLAO|nr:endonuclease [Flaviramulus multivorans]MCF7561356.1 endonuclease [Flaviramulus multivorans]